MKPEEITAAAKAAPPKVHLEEYREAVESLRKKGYSWREVADFLSERGVTTDHTRLYRLFGESNQQRKKEAKQIEISRLAFVGERASKRGRSWCVVEIDIPSRLGKPITVLGYIWGTGAPLPSGLSEGDPISFRNATLITRSGRKGFPMAYVQAELQTEGDRFTLRDIYIVPKWDALL